MDIDEFSQVVGDIYDLTPEKGHWIGVLERIAVACDAGSASIASGNRAQELSILCSVVTPDQISEYQSQWADKDPSMGALARSVPGQFLTLEDVGGHDVFRKTEVYDRFWLKTDHSPEHLRTKVHQDQDGWMVFALNARLEDNEILNSSVEAFARFVPHLRRASEIQRRFRSAFFRDAVDGSMAGAPGVLLVNPAGRVIYNDALAEEIFESNSGVIRQSGFIEFAQVSETAMFLKLLHSCFSPVQNGASRGGKMQTMGSEPTSLEILPISKNEPNIGLEFLADAGSIALVLIDCPKRRREGVLQQLRDAYDLTNAESQVALEAFSASSRAELAAKLGVAESTVRTHLTRIYEKTGTRRQAQLARMIGPYVMGSGSEG